MLRAHSVGKFCCLEHFLGVVAIKTQSLVAGRVLKNCCIFSKEYTGTPCAKVTTRYQTATRISTGLINIDVIQKRSNI